jgi:hypothetical protein
VKKLGEAELTGNEAVIRTVVLTGPAIVTDHLGELYSCSKCPRALVKGDPAESRLVGPGGKPVVIICPKCGTPNWLAAEGADPRLPRKRQNAPPADRSQRGARRHIAGARRSRS